MLPKLSPGTFYGERRKSQQIADLILTESIYSQNFSIPRHSHESAFFLFVLQGACTETSETRTRSCDSSVLVFHPAGERHQAIWDQTGGRCFNLEFVPNWLDPFCEQQVRLDQPADFDGGCQPGSLCGFIKSYSGWMMSRPSRWKDSRSNWWLRRHASVKRLWNASRRAGWNKRANFFTLTLQTRCRCQKSRRLLVCIRLI